MRRVKRTLAKSTTQAARVCADCGSPRDPTYLAAAGRNQPAAPLVVLTAQLHAAFRLRAVCFCLLVLLWIVLLLSLLLGLVCSSCCCCFLLGWRWRWWGCWCCWLLHSCALRVSLSLARRGVSGEGVCRVGVVLGWWLAWWLLVWCWVMVVWCAKHPTFPSKDKKTGAVQRPVRVY